MKIDIELTDDQIEKIMLAELRDLKMIVAGPSWESAREDDIEAIERVIEFYGG